MPHGEYAPVTPDPRLVADELDLTLASELQAALLPTGCPEGWAEQRTATRNRMCGNVGGDFFDFIRLHDDLLALVIGDVVGHGVRAALLMAKIMGMLHTDSSLRSRPVEMVQVLNRMLIELGERVGCVLPCSLFYGVIDGPSGTGFFVNAGHPEPVLTDRTSGAVSLLGTHDLLLGVEEYEPVEICHTFSPGDRLVLYTDGITDAADPDRRHFGVQRLMRLLAAHRQTDAEAVADAVLLAVDDFRRGEDPTDDETLVVLDRL